MGGFLTVCNQLHWRGLLSTPVAATHATPPLAWDGQQSAVAETAHLWSRGWLPCPTPGLLQGLGFRFRVSGLNVLRDNGGSNSKEFENEMDTQLRARWGLWHLGLGFCFCTIGFGVWGLGQRIEWGFTPGYLDAGKDLSRK